MARGRSNDARLALPRPSKPHIWSAKNSGQICETRNVGCAATVQWRLWSQSSSEQAESESTPINTNQALSTSIAWKQVDQGPLQSSLRIFHNIRSANDDCRRKAKMSALSKVGMSVFPLLVVRFGGCGSDGCGADEQARTASD